MFKLNFRYLPIWVGALTTACAAGMGLASPASAQGCASPSCDPNWAFQNRMNAQREREQQMMMMEEYLRQSDGYIDPSSYTPPEYQPPVLKPPRGWRSRFGAYLDYTTYAPFDESYGVKRRMRYAVAVNFEREVDARKAVQEICIREATPAEWQNCSSNRIETITSPYFRLSLSPAGAYGFEIKQATELREVTWQQNEIVLRERLRRPCDNAARELGHCFDPKLGIGRNGIHQQAVEKEARNFFPCPNGTDQAGFGVVGVDGSTGTAVPLCGPDWDAIEATINSDKYDGFALHPRYDHPFVVGGRSSAAEAQQAALSLCAAVAGAGCSPMGTYADGYTVVAANDRGEIFLGKGKSVTDAKLDAQRQCNAGPDLLLPCMIISERVAGEDLRVDLKDSTHNRGFGAVALPGGRITETRLAGITQNMNSMEEAERYALQACASANPSGPKCQIVAKGGGHAAFVGWVGIDGSGGVFSMLDYYHINRNSDDYRGKKILKILCEDRGTLCKQSAGPRAASDGGANKEPVVETWEIRPFMKS